jgi:hypothetical protein
MRFDPVSSFLGIESVPEKEPVPVGENISVIPKSSDNAFIAGFGFYISPS